MKKNLWLIFGSGLFLVISGLAGFGYFLIQPNYGQAQKVKIVITPGESVAKIATQLCEKKLIYHPLIFKLAVKQVHLSHQLKAGSFTLEGRLSPLVIARKLATRPEDTWIRLLVGWRREEMANYLAKQDLIAFNKKEFLRLAKDKEGYLFPDTYLIPKEISTQALVNLFLNTFSKKVKQGLAQSIATSSHSLKEALIVASLLEREAQGEPQMRHVAGIIYNRLKIGMPLQIDATLQYASGWNQQKQTYWSSPSADLKNVDSPYNTYKRAGLPPQPIANPGLSAIRAALDPLKTTDLYYLHAPDGRIYYARTLTIHNRNIARYLH